MAPHRPHWIGASFSALGGSDILIDKLPQLSQTILKADGSLNGFCSMFIFAAGQHAINAAR
jgi:hypothetical protein